MLGSRETIVYRVILPLQLVIFSSYGPRSNHLLFLFKIEPTLVADQDRAGCRFSGRECREGSLDQPFPCALDILFLILVGADRSLDDIIAVILLRCGSLGHQDFVPSYDRSIECLVRERRLYIELYYLAACNILFVRTKIESSLVSVQDRAYSCC